MGKNKYLRFTVIGIVLLLGVYWSLSSAQSKADRPLYPGGEYLASANWLKQHKDDENAAIVDVREDKYFDGKLIPGAIRLPWKNFTYDNTALGIGGAFVGTDRAQAHHASPDDAGR